MVKIGTEYGGWHIPDNIFLNDNSTIISAGVGEDISFDIGIQSLYNCTIFLIDPTERSYIHYKECKKYYKNKEFVLSGNIQSDYYKNIQKYNPNFDKIKYIDVGLWNKKDSMKFYKQSNKSYVSQSLINGMFTTDYTIVNVDTLNNIMQQNNITHIDLFKLDIEGAEISVINNMLDNEIYPSVLCIEFDLMLKNKDTNNTTYKTIERLMENNYSIFKNDNWNITFVR